VHYDCITMASQQVVFRLSDDLADELERYATRTRRRRSEILRDALRAYLPRTGGAHQKPAERVAHLIGAVETGQPDLAENSRRYILESLRRGR
jgi:metal-responsive CopG/Arc/MetJ family transcriptional regulator